MVVIVEEFESQHIGKVSPTYEALLLSELDQQRVTEEMTREGEEEEEGEGAKVNV
jgi:hypothetical protein